MWALYIYTFNRLWTHRRAALKILAYVQSTQDVGLLYRRNAPVHLVGVTDASFAGDPDERHSQGGYLYLLGGSAVSWKSYWISTVVRSTPEAEYVAASDSAAEGIFLRNFLGELGFPKMGPTPIFTDLTGVQGMVISPATRCRTEHIKIHYHYVRDHVAQNSFVLHRVECWIGRLDTRLLV